MSRRNSAEYAWCDVTVAFMGKIIERITSVEYDNPENKKYLYGRGKKVKGIAPGNEEPNVSMTLGQSELEAMIRKAQETNPTASYKDLVFDIQVVYMVNMGDPIVIDRIVGAEPTKAPKTIKQGDSDMEVQMELMAMDILYNVKN